MKNKLVLDGDKLQRISDFLERKGKILLIDRTAGKRINNQLFDQIFPPSIYVELYSLLCKLMAIKLFRLNPSLISEEIKKTIKMMVETLEFNDVPNECFAILSNLLKRLENDFVQGNLEYVLEQYSSSHKSLSDCKVEIKFPWNFSLSKEKPGKAQTDQIHLGNVKIHVSFENNEAIKKLFINDIEIRHGRGQ